MCAPRSLIQGEVRWVWCFESASWVVCMQPSPKPKKPAVSTCWQSLWASRIFAFLSCHSVLHVAPIGFQGKKTQHRALCAQEIGD
ncbi:hypothetical protein ACX10_22250 [Vibrio parahaemolyticus]|nr:hypothetical protein ACX10_22250 [Vibrio parahaemolyticus]